MSQVAAVSPLDAEQDDRWIEVDPFILEGRKIQAMLRIRAEFGVGIRDGIDLLGWRYEKLRRERPDDFSMSPEQYWDGFYS
ncbi:hypothetical protein [Kitasatospora sp. HPMI-4]|uniref:hypothetical protein n=1 Tax=Kitasatospora sp. HPMI-4 TaxID=3448443 RepID=UPI003F1CCAFE